MWRMDFKKDDGSWSKASYYMEDIFIHLEHIQETSSLIDSECEICNDYEAQRLSRKLFTTNAQLQGVQAQTIELKYRW